MEKSRSRPDVESRSIRFTHNFNRFTRGVNHSCQRKDRTMTTNHRLKNLLAALALGCQATLVAAAQAPVVTPLPPPSGEKVLRPKLACGDLRAMTGYEFSIEIATLIPANGDLPSRC